MNNGLEPKWAHAETEDGWLQLQGGGDGEWQGGGLTLVLKERDGVIDLLIASAPGAAPVKTVKLYAEWNPPAGRKPIVLGDHWERGYGDLEWRGFVPERRMPWYFLVHDGDSTIGYGVRTGGRALCHWNADAQLIVLTVDVSCGRDGVVLGERVLHAATIVTFADATGRSAFECAREFCAAMCERPRLPDHPVYGGNNWYYAYGRSSHEKIMRDSDFVSSLAAGESNRPYMVIDDGWQLTAGDGFASGGPWTGNHLFPDMSRLAKEMGGTGVRPGLWFRPLLVSERVPDAWKRYRNELGTVLDPSIPDVLDYIGSAVRSMVGWGYELLKHDFTTFDLLGQWGFQMKSKPGASSQPFADRSKTTAEIVLGLYETIAEASGGSLVIGCNTFSHLSAGLFEIQRTGDDTSGKSWERTRRMGINTLAFRMPQHLTFYSHDADCVGITPTVPWELNRQWLQLLAQSGTPLFVSADPDIVSDEQKRELREAFRSAAQPLPAGEPLDWLTTSSPTRWRLNGKEETFSWHADSLDLPNREDVEWWR